jgi:hypothetical protein
MPTIAEIIAAKAAAKVAAAKPQAAPAAAGPPASKLSIAEKAEFLAIDKRLADVVDLKPLAAAKPRGIILSKDLPKGENRGQATPIAGPPEVEERALAVTTGEVIDVTPHGADAETAAWHSALTSLESDLCVMRDQEDPEVCWLALKSVGTQRRPLLLHRLPWLLWDHPETQRPEDQPF